MPPPRAHFELFDAADGVRWRSQSSNGRYDGHSDQSFDDDSHAERAVLDHVRTVAVAIGAHELAALDDYALRQRVEIERVEA